VPSRAENAPQSAPQRWIAGAVARRWPNASIASLTQLRGDASARRFWRITIDGERVGAPASAIAVDLGPDDLPHYVRALNLVPTPPPKPPWITMRQLFAAGGVAVPELFAADVESRMLLVEDVGELPLAVAAARGDAADLYRLAADQLLLIHRGCTELLPADCIAAKIAYDERLFRWELEQFVELGAADVPGRFDARAVARDLDDLAARLGGYPRVLSHRDYHGENLYLQFASAGAPRLRVIDFQDALMAPAAQDLSVLLTTRNASEVITPAIERRVLDYYYAAYLRRGPSMPLGMDEFAESYRLCVIQHALKVIGRFRRLELDGKPGYARFIPYALAQARRMLAGRGDFAGLRAALDA
jgi:aminoglycoside/choline kinase family phosphotransferase